MSLHLQANTTNIYKIRIISRSDCHLHQTVDLAECRINTSPFKPIPVATSICHALFLIKTYFNIMYMFAGDAAAVSGHAHRHL